MQLMHIVRMVSPVTIIVLKMYTLVTKNSCFPENSKEKTCLSLFLIFLHKPYSPLQKVSTYQPNPVFFVSFSGILYKQKSIGIVPKLANLMRRLHIWNHLH